MVGNIAYLVAVSISVTHAHTCSLHKCHLRMTFTQRPTGSALIPLWRVSLSQHKYEWIGESEATGERHKGHMNQFDWSGHFQENWFPLLLVFLKVWSYKSNFYAKDLNFSNYIIFHKDQIYALISQSKEQLIKFQSKSIYITIILLSGALYSIPATRTA